MLVLHETNPKSSDKNETSYSIITTTPARSAEKINGRVTLNKKIHKKASSPVAMQAP